MSTPKDQVRASIAMTHCFSIAERLLQADKCNPSFKLTDLRDDNERGIYIDAAASFLLDQVGRTERTHLLNQTRAHGFASVEDEHEQIAQQAQRDIAQYGGVANFGDVRPGCCWLCRQPITLSDGIAMEISATLRVDVHGHCASEHPKCEMVSAFAFRWRGGAR